MTGTLDTMSLSDARRDSTSDQSRLASFGNEDGGETTYVGIANSNDNGYNSVVDETETRLAPPDDLFFQWYNTRDSLMSGGMMETNAHNKALEQIDYFERFEHHLNTTQAQEALTQLTERVKAGEDIVLVCYCGGAKQCHRHPVAERIQARL